MSSYQIDTRKKYDDSYKKSVNNPETFWDELASQNFIWNKKWSKVVDWDFKKANNYSFFKHYWQYDIHDGGNIKPDYYLSLIHI